MSQFPGDFSSKILSGNFDSLPPNQGPIALSIIFTKDYIDSGNNIKKGTIWDNVFIKYGGNGIAVEWSAKKTDGTGISGIGHPPYERYQGVSLSKSEIEKAMGQITPIKAIDKGYTDDFYYSKIGIDGSQIKISERLKKWNDNDVEKAFNMIPYPVINPDPSMKMAKSTSEIDDAIIVEMERRNKYFRPRLLGDFSEPDKYYRAKKIGLMLLIVFGGISALVFAYKKYPTATKWIVGISVALFALVFICFFLFFSMGGPNKYERYLQKYIEPSKHKESTKIKEVDYTLAQPAVI